jgi:hypothetical protein
MGATAVASIRAARWVQRAAWSRRLTPRRPIVSPMLLKEFNEGPAEAIRAIAGGAFGVVPLAR